MAIILKQNPAVGDTVAQGEMVWEWNGRAWIKRRPNVTTTGAQVLTNKELTNPAQTTQVLVDSPNISWDANLGATAEVTLGGNRTIATPLNMKKGSRLVLYVKQDAVGGRTLTFGSGFNISETYSLSAVANSVDVFVFYVNVAGNQAMGRQVFKSATSSTAPPPPSSPTPPPPSPSPAPPAPTPPPASSTLAMGPSLNGMEWSNLKGVNHRKWTSSRPNINFSVPRRQDIYAMAAIGMKKTRLLISWEMLQPIRASSNANAAVRAAYGISANGAFNEVYAQYIDQVLTWHQNAGIKCILVLANNGRYRDFIYEADGSVVGFVNPSDELVQPYTTDATKVRTCIMAKAAGATLTVADFNDFWTRAANRWKNHVGFGGYGLMDQVENMPVLNGTVEQFVDASQDLTIWTHFATQAYNAIRAVDTTGTVYLTGNNRGNSVEYSTKNTNFPIAGATNVVYAVNMFLDNGSLGTFFDFPTEQAKATSFGEGAVAIHNDTGVNRLNTVKNWASSNGALKLALWGTGMPLHHATWTEMFKRTLDFCITNGIEVYASYGGNLWDLQSYPMNATLEWYQGRTCMPLVTGQMQRALGQHDADIFDAGPGYSTAAAITITVFARGSLTSPIVLTPASSNGGSFSPTSVTLAANVANPSATYQYTPGANRVTTITYSGNPQVPPPRKVYSLTDPVAYAATSLSDAAGAILAKYLASKWDASDAYTDYVSPDAVAATASGNAVRAIADSGWGSSLENIMDMKVFHNYMTNSGWFTETPLAIDSNSKRYVDFNGAGRRGLWAKKRKIVSGVHLDPKSKVPYLLSENHFALACIRVSTNVSGAVYAASETETSLNEELNLNNGVPRLIVRGANGESATLAGSAVLPTGQPVVISMRNNPGNQRLRVNSTEVATGTVTFSSAQMNQIFMGGNWLNHWPIDPFAGGMYALVVGAGNPSDAELQVLENYLLSNAGVSASPAPPPPSPPPPPPSQSLDDIVVGIFAGGQAGAIYDAGTMGSLFRNIDGTNVVTAADQDVGTINDRSGRGNHINQAVNTDRQPFRIVSGLQYIDFWTKGLLEAGTGGSTSGIFLGFAVDLGGGYYNTFFDDRSGTNNGYFLRYDGDFGQIFFSRGNGSSRTQISKAFTPGVKTVVMAWHDGVNLYLEVNASAASPVAASAASAGGSAAFGAKVDGGEAMYSKFYASVIAKNSALTSTDRANIRTWLGQRMGLSL